MKGNIERRDAPVRLDALFKKSVRYALGIYER
jgi:hypothetical protein